MSIKDIRNFDDIILLCKNMNETRIFYKDVMGFPIEFDSDSWVSFRVGSTLLTLRPRGPSLVH
jgi:lactoylglutathione lyase